MIVPRSPRLSVAGTIASGCFSGAFAALKLAGEGHMQAAARLLVAELQPAIDVLGGAGSKLTDDGAAGARRRAAIDKVACWLPGDRLALLLQALPC